MSSVDYGRYTPSEIERERREKARKREQFWENFWGAVIAIFLSAVGVVIIFGFGALLIKSEEEDNKRYNEQCSQIVKLAEGRDMKRDGQKCYFIKNDKLEAVDL